MEITYKTRKIEKVCTIASEAEKKYGSEMAEKIHQRIDEIDASDTVEEMVQFHIIIKVPFHLGGITMVKSRSFIATPPGATIK